MEYTYIDRLGNRIFHRYFDREDSRHHAEVVTEFPIHLYMLKQNGDYTSLFNEKLVRVSFDTITEAKDFEKRYDGVAEIYGNTDYVQQFIARNYADDVKFDIANFRRVSVDIEVEHDDGFPEPSVAENEILSISMKIFGGENIAYGYNDLERDIPGLTYIKVRNEIELLSLFVDKFRRVAPHILTGWNVYGFDVPYLVNRINKVLGENAANKLSMFSDKSKNCVNACHNKEGTDSYKILGLTVLDYMELYKKFSPNKQESYKLGYIGEVEGVGSKVDYSDYGNNLMRLYRENFQRFIEYNDVDNLLVEQLDAKLQFLGLGVAIAMLTKSRISDCTGTVKIWDNLIYHMCLKEGIQIPPAVRNSAAEKQGGYVKATIPGMYRWPTTFDLTSLYPSIARMLNMSPETVLSDQLGGIELVDHVLEGKLLPEDYTSDGVCFAINGATFSTKVEGIVAKAMTFVFNERKRYKKMMLVEKDNKQKSIKEGTLTPEEELRFDNLIGMLNSYQLAVKVVANGGYGALGNESFRYYRPVISDAITMTGQYIIRFIAGRLNEFLNGEFSTKDVDYVIGSDTDSVMVSLENFVKMIDPQGKAKTGKLVEAVDQYCAGVIEPFLEAEYKKLAERLNARINTLDMKREAICDVGLFRAKKNYILRVWDMEHVRYTEPYLKIAGIETQRTTTPMICKEKLKEMIPVILDGTQDQLIEEVAKFKTVFMAAPISQIAFPKGVSEFDKWVSESDAKKNVFGESMQDETVLRSGTPINTRASIVYNQMLDKFPELASSYEKIKPKSKIKYVYLKQPNYTMGNVIAFIDELPKEFGLHPKIDKELQFEKTFASPLKSLSSLIGWDIVKVNTLEDLFS